MNAAEVLAHRRIVSALADVTDNLEGMGYALSSKNSFSTQYNLHLRYVFSHLANPDRLAVLQFAPITLSYSLSITSPLPRLVRPHSTPHST